jgi:hypothetical protein
LERQIQHTKGELDQITRLAITGNAGEESQAFASTFGSQATAALNPLAASGMDPSIDRKHITQATDDKPILSRPLRVFLCHSSSDKSAVRNIYYKLHVEGVDPWLDEEKLLPGQDWELEIPKAVRSADVVIVCLSQKSVTKAGYVQKEIKYTLDVADEQPEGAIFLIPVKLEECEVPQRLRRWQWVNLFEDRGWARLMLALRKRADEIGVTVPSYLQTSRSPSPAGFRGTYTYLEDRFLYFLQIVLGFAVGGIASIAGNALIARPGIVIAGLAILVLTTVILLEPRLRKLRIFAISSMIGFVIASLILFTGITILPGEKLQIRTS